MTPTPEDLRLAQEWRNTLIQSELKHLDTFRAEARREAEKRLQNFLDGYRSAAERINRELGTNEDFERIERELWETQTCAWDLHVIEKINHLRQSEREACERIVQGMIGTSDWSRTGYDTCIEILRRLRKSAEPPAGNLWCNLHNKHREGSEPTCPECLRERAK